MTIGAPQFEPRWPNSKAILVGWLAGQGFTSPAIADRLADGTSAASIRPQLQRAGIIRRKGTRVPIYLSPYDLRVLGLRATSEGLEPAEWVRQITTAAIRDDMFRAIVDSG